MKIILILILITTGLMTDIYSQNMHDYQWENRLLLIISDDENNIQLVDQLNELNRDTKGLEERKLLVFIILPDQYKKGLIEENWSDSSDLYLKYNKKKLKFNVILIGLDGTVKSEKNEMMTNQELFGIIDKMPMRQYEIRGN